MYGPTTMFQLSATVPNLCPQAKSSLINRLINDRLLYCLTNRHSDVASIHPDLAQNVNRALSVTPPRFCNLRTKVWNVMKSQVGAITEVRHLATKLLDGCACTVRNCRPRRTIKT